MKRILLWAVAFVLLGASVARADLPPPPPPKPPTKPTKPALDTTTIVAVSSATAGVVLAGVWVVRSRSRVQPLN